MNDGKKLLDKPKSAAREPHKGLIAIIICSAIAVTGITAAIILNVNQEHESERSTVTVKDLTDEQKEKLGITDDNKASGEESEIEDEEHYSDEYKKYLELPDDEKEKLDVVPRKNDVPKDKIDTIKDGTDGTIVAELPQKFDLRDTIDITVGDQGDYGICWSFASSTALETHLKLRGIDYNPSEFQIDFLSSSLMYGSRNLHGGGSFQSFADVASSIGAISEDMFSGLNINTDGSRNNGNIDLDYLKLAKNNEPLYVTKTVDFPSVYKEYGIVTDRTEEELEEFRNLVKAHIMTNGSLYASTTVPWGWGIPRYCEKSMSSCYINHAVSIIGWDDTYPKEKFGKVNEDGKRIEGTPVHDGAYLVLNSYGEGWDGSGAKNGVYYISYDEYSIESQLSGIVSTSLDDATKISSIASQTVKDIINEKLSLYIIEKDNEQYISDYARNKVSYLDLSSRGLNNNDLRGIAEAFPNLTSLYMAENNISDLAPMSKLKELYSVDLTKNNITDVSALCSEEKLSWIELGYNKITDVSCLNDKFAKNEYSHLNISGNKGVVGYENLTNLDALIADDIGLKSLESLRKLTKLSSLQVRNNDIKSLDGLSTTNTSFGHLDVSGNRNLKSLKFDKPVWRLTIDDAGLEDISILNDIAASAVSAAGNSFNDLSGFNNKGIESLDLSRNKNLSNFSALGAVNNLLLSDCDIKSFTELSGLDNVKWLTLDNNKISSFDGAENIKNIISLVLTKNKLASLDGVNKLEKIQSLVIDDNQILSLAGIEKLTELSSIAADNNNISSADELLDLGSLYFASFNNNKFTSIPNFTKQSGIYLAFANNPLESAILPKNTTAINLKDCSLKHIDYSAAERLSNVNLEGNPDWNDYQNIISRSILKQQERGESYPYFYATTDYNFSEEDKNNLSNISGGNDYANWNIALTEYTIELKKSPEGIVNLEKQPDKRLMFMHLLRSGVKIKGFKIDKAASKLILDDKTAESLSLDLEQTTIVHGEAHLMTNKVKLVFKSDAND